MRMCTCKLPCFFHVLPETLQKHLIEATTKRARCLSGPRSLMMAMVQENALAAATCQSCKKKLQLRNQEERRAPQDVPSLALSAQEDFLG